MAEFDNLIQGDINDAVVVPSQDFRKATGIQRKDPAELTQEEIKAKLEEQANALNLVSKVDGTPKKGQKAIHKKLTDAFNRTRSMLTIKSEGEDTGQPATGLQGPATADAGTSMKAKLAGRSFDPEEQTETTETTQPAAEPRAAAGVGPAPTYNPPETVGEAMQQPSADNDELGGPGSIAYESGFRADMDDIDADLKAGLDDLAKKRGWIAVIQGLGMAASAWYGLQNNVDMSGINFQQTPKFEAEEQAIMDKVKFRRQQLLAQRKEDISQRERTQDLERRQRERREDKAESQAKQDYKSRWNAYVQDIKSAQFKEEQELEWAKLDLNKLKLEKKVTEAKAKKTRAIKDMARAEQASFKTAWSPIQKIRNIDPKKRPEEVSDERKIAAVENLFTMLKSANPDRVGELEAAQKKLITPGVEDSFLWFDKDPEVAFDAVNKEIDALNAKGALKYSPASTLFEEQIREETGYTKEAQALEETTRQVPVEAEVPTRYTNPQMESYVQSQLDKNPGRSREEIVRAIRQAHPNMGY